MSLVIIAANENITISITYLIGCSGSEAVHIVCCLVCFTLSGSADGVSEGYLKIINKY